MSDTEKMKIPEAAAEAALDAYYDRGGLTFAAAHPDTRALELDDMRAALEAAAPHFASAWHDAVSNAYVDGALSADQARVMYGANPYRTVK